MNHTQDDQAARPESGRAGRGKTALVSVMILLAGVALMVLIFKTEPTATRGDVARETAMLVEVRTAERGRFTPVIEVMGQVVPAREVTLQPRVSGRVIELAEAFEPGGRVAEGSALLRIDPADYQVALRQRRSELAQARADLELEQGRLGEIHPGAGLLQLRLAQHQDPGNRDLVLRQPQLKQARARVDFAEAALRRAELDLQRTRISAPFDAQILSRDVATGSQVGSGDSLARLVATDRYWVAASVPLSQLRWLRFAEQGAPVSLRHEAAWGPSRSRQGRLQRLVGELDANARLARVLVSVEDPLALRADAGTPSLMLGAFVRTAIEGRALDDVVRLDRNLLRREDTVWVMEDGALDIRDVTVLLRDGDYAYISEGLEQGDQVVATDLATVVDGAALRLENAAGGEPLE
jgi:RND family efflux transporter MFP subunit